MTRPFDIEPLGRHDRRGFTCGGAVLDRYFRELVPRDRRRRSANCFVAVQAAGTVAGYYTLSAAGLPMSELPAKAAQRPPRHRLLPACRISRLAIAGAAREQGLAAALVIDAVSRAPRRRDLRPAGRFQGRHRGRVRLRATRRHAVSPPT